MSPAQITPEQIAAVNPFGLLSPLSAHRLAALSAPFELAEIKTYSGNKYVEWETVLERLHFVYGPRISTRPFAIDEHGLTNALISGHLSPELKGKPTTEVVLCVEVIIWDDEHQREIKATGIGGKIYDAPKKGLADAFKAAFSKAAKNASKLLGIKLDGGLDAEPGIDFEFDPSAGPGGFLPPPPSLGGPAAPPAPPGMAAPPMAPPPGPVAPPPAPAQQAPAPIAPPQAYATPPEQAYAPQPQTYAAPPAAPAPAYAQPAPPPAPAPLAPPVYPPAPQQAYAAQPPQPPAPPQGYAAPPAPAPAGYAQPVPPAAPPYQAPPVAPAAAPVPVAGPPAPPAPVGYPPAPPQGYAAPPPPVAPAPVAPPPAAPAGYPPAPPPMAAPAPAPVAPPPAAPAPTAHQHASPYTCSVCNGPILDSQDGDGNQWSAQEVYETTSSPDTGYGRPVCVTCIPRMGAPGQAQQAAAA